MTFDPKVETLEDLMKLDSGYPFSSSAWVESGTPVIKIKNVKNGYVDLSGCSYVDAESARAAADWLGKVGNTLIALTGAGVGEIGRIRDGQVGLINQRVGWVRAHNAEEEDFIYYLLRYLKPQIIELASGSAQQNVSPWSILSIPCQVPSGPERKAIGSILASLDSKIVSNLAISKTLENIAQATFKSWFIDFDPVKAKMAGEKPLGMNDETASLFPSSFEESGLGEIPVGWEVVPSTDMFEILSGGTPKTSNEEYWNGEIPWFSVVDTPNDGGCFFIKTAKTITQEGLRNSAAKLVRPGITVISARGTVGKTAIAATQSTFNQSCYGVEGKYGDFLTFLLLKNQISRLQNISHGGMFDTITRETFSSVFVAKPSSGLMALFESIVEPMFLEIRTRQFQNQELSEIRDALLPRLVSGELQIPEEMLAS